VDGAQFNSGIASRELNSINTVRQEKVGGGCSCTTPRRLLRPSVLICSLHPAVCSWPSASET